MNRSPSETWADVFGNIDPREFWVKSKADGCHSADEAVDLAICGYPPFFFEIEALVTLEDAELLSRHLVACVPEVPNDFSEDVCLSSQQANDHREIKESGPGQPIFIEGARARMLRYLVELLLPISFRRS